MLFLVKSIDKNTNKEVRLFLQKDSYADLISYLEDKNITFFSISKLPNFAEFFYNNISISKISDNDIIFLFETLSGSMKAGISLLDSLHDIASEVDNQTLKNVVNEIIEDLEYGYSFVDSCKKHPEVFKEDVLIVLEIGQESGNFIETLKDIALTSKNKQKLSSSIKQSMIYPISALVVVIGVFFFWGIYIIPKIVKNLSGTNLELPSTTIALADFFLYVEYNWEFIILLILLAVISLIILFKKCKKCQYYLWSIFSKFPGVSTMVREYNMVLISRYISLILTAGKPLSYAIETLENSISNKVYANKLESIKNELFNGKQLSETIADSKLFTRVFYRAIAAGELNGNLGKELFNVSEYYSDILFERSKLIPKIIEPIVTVVLGLLILLLIFSFLAPIYDLILSI